MQNLFSAPTSTSAFRNHPLGLALPLRASPAARSSTGPSRADWRFETTMGDWVSTLSGVGMAVGPPAVYADQFVNIIRSQNSAGFSIDICGVLIIANTSRIFFWFAERYETALLVQSILMILAQFGQSLSSLE